MSRFNYGGQAVLEGVMMRGQTEMSVAVRKPNGDVVLHTEKLTSAIYGSRLAKIPLLRGLIMLWETLALGMRSLLFSANVALSEEPEVEMSKPVVGGTLLFSLAFSIGLFFVLPLLIIGSVDHYIASSFLSNLLEGVIRLGVFLGYLTAIGFLRDVRRVFGYHGAEHKSINAYEAGAPLEVAHVRRFSTAHPRCGTTFLLLIMVISVFVFALLGRPSMEMRILSRIVLVPVVAAVAYEFIKLAAAQYHRSWVRFVMAPGLVLQSLTTREPDDSMLEVAIAALKAVLVHDGVVQEVAISESTPALPDIPALGNLGAPSA